MEPFVEKSFKKMTENSFIVRRDKDPDMVAYVDEQKRINENLFYKKGLIDYISLDLLLTNIATDDTADYGGFDISKGLLLQFDSFIKPQHLIRKAKSLFHYFVNVKKHFPRSFVFFMNQWIILRWADDFADNQEMSKEMKFFYIELRKYPEAKDDEELKINQIVEIFEQDCREEAEFLLQKLKHRRRSKIISMRFESLSAYKLTDHFDVLVWPELEIARQLSLYTHYFMSRIELKELLSARWTKKTKYNDSPNVMACIERFNKLILWVCEEILSYDKSRVRALVVEKFLKIAYCCRKICNFNDCYNIISALNSLPLKYLSKTWKKLPTEGLRLFLELTNFISCENNYRILREETAKAKGKPYIPYLGLFLKELAYIEEGPKYLKNGLINIDKLKKVGGIFDDFIEMKSTAYLFKLSSDLMFLSQPKTRTEDELIELANKLGKSLFTSEPQFILYKTKSKKKRPSTTDSNLYLLNPTHNEIFVLVDKELYSNTVTNIIEDFFL